MYLTLIILVVILLIISFLWALHSLNKDLKKINERERVSKKNIGLGRGEEVILFDRSKKD